jgi:hypothetical protein
MIFIVGGIRPEIYAQVQAGLSDAIGRGNRVIFAPYRVTGPGSAAEARNHALDLLGRAADYIERDRESCNSGLVALLFDPSEAEFDAFSGAFFPWTIVVKAELPKRAGNAGARSIANLVFQALQSAANRGRSSVKAMTVEAKEWMNRTPLLLPLRNFDSKALRPELAHLFQELPDAQAPGDLLSATRKRIEKYHPRIGSKKSQKYYVDDRGVRFKMPGRHMHGVAHRAEGHQTQCFLNGLLRLGGRIVEGFHYDCSVEGKRMRGSRSNCHDANEDVDGDYVNIASNDFLRGV